MAHSFVPFSVLGTKKDKPADPKAKGPKGKGDSDPSKPKYQIVSLCYFSGCQAKNPHLKSCTRCKLAYYCNKTCQNADFQSHKTACRKSSQLMTQMLDAHYSGRGGLAQETYCQWKLVVIYKIILPSKNPEIFQLTVLLNKTGIVNKVFYYLFQHYAEMGGICPRILTGGFLHIYQMFLMVTMAPTDIYLLLIRGIQENLDHFVDSGASMGKGASMETFLRRSEVSTSRETLCESFWEAKMAGGYPHDRLFDRLLDLLADQRLSHNWVKYLIEVIILELIIMTDTLRFAKERHMKKKNKGNLEEVMKEVRQSDFFQREKATILRYILILDKINPRILKALVNPQPLKSQRFPAKFARGSAEEAYVELEVNLPFLEYFGVVDELKSLMETFTGEVRPAAFEYDSRMFLSRDESHEKGGCGAVCSTDFFKVIL